MCQRMFLAPLLLVATLHAALPDRITPLGWARSEPLGLEAVYGELRLPAKFQGATLHLAPGENSLELPILVPPKSLLTATHEREAVLLKGQREDQQEQARFWPGSEVSKAFQDYAKSHGNRGPASLKDPAFLELLSAKPVQRERIVKNLQGYGLIPQADFSNPSAPLLLQLTPRLDDGRHWVFNTQLIGQKQPINLSLVKQTGQSLSRDRITPLPPRPPGPEDIVPFEVIALKRKQTTSAHLELMEGNRTLGRLTFAMPAKGTAGKGLEPLATWLQYRASTWTRQAPLSKGLWAAAESAYTHAGLKGIHARKVLDQLEGSRNIRPTDPAPSMVALLGGRAAVDETLQLNRQLSVRSDGKLLPLESVKGVETPSHPWAEMRQKKSVPPLPMANYVPLDRALLFLPNPAGALASMEGGGSTFLQRVNCFTGEGPLDTTLVERALADLGLGNGLGRKLIATGAVKQAVIFCSDLALMAGTELTMIAELTPLASTILPLPGEDIQAKGSAFRARRGRNVFVSTSRSELAKALALHDNQGKGSLGQSDELAVVLDKLAPASETELYVYLPDAFIRQLVGPRQRILQWRQAEARRQMEVLAAAALLRKMDVPSESVTLKQLKALHYIPLGLDLTDLRLNTDGSVAHAQFGPLAHLTPLERLELPWINEGEAKAYEDFRTGYQRYWQRYFDPIAMRLDAAANGEMRLETFVLPLLDTSIYSGLKNIVVEGPRALPHWEIPLVAELGLKIAPTILGTEGPVGHLLEGMEFGETFTGNFAVGFPDSAPVIQVGGGSPATILDAAPLGPERHLMAWGAMALGALTRPVVVALELKDPAAATRSLKRLGTQGLPLPHSLKEFESRLLREPNDRLLLRLGFLGMASFRLTARIEDRWLVLSNDTTLPSPLISGTEAAHPFPVALRIRPGALKLGLPAAFQSAMEGEAKAAWASINWMAPWLLSGYSLENARQESHRLLGLAPLLAPEDLPTAGSLEHRRFGTPYAPRIPSFNADLDFGLLEGVKRADVELRFEDTGLRARVRWAK